MKHRWILLGSLLNVALACSDANDGSSDATGGANGNSGGRNSSAGANQNGAGEGGEAAGFGGRANGTGGRSARGGSSATAGAGGDATEPGGAGGTDSTTGGSDAAGAAGDPVSTNHFFLPTGEPDNTSAPSLEVDAQGGIHAVYPAYAGGNAYYAYCPADCRGRDDVRVVMFETEGTVANAMLSLTAAGKPRVLLSAYRKVYFASCDANCGVKASWTIGEILDHESDREISGEALALDPSGHPRFLMHTYRAYLGIGQKPPKTWYASCESACTEAASWTFAEIAQEIWEGTALRFDANGGAHIATVVNFNEGERAGQKLSAYLECPGPAASACAGSDDWNGIGFIKPYESRIEAVTVYPTVSLALTRAGAPRLAVLGESDAGKKNILYFECDADCTKDNWQGALVTEHDQLDAGLDLTLDANDHPRFAYTLNYNIGLAYCDTEPCGGPGANWDLTKVELSGEIPPDEIFLWENCTIGAWFLHSPSVALTLDGKPRVGYQARDISGGFSQPNPTKPGCTAGTDMTWSRLAVMSSYK